MSVQPRAVTKTATELAPVDAGQGRWHATNRVRIPYEAIEPIALTTDFVLIVVVSMACGLGYHLAAFHSLGDPRHYLGIGAVVALLITLVNQVRGLYRPTELMSLWTQGRDLCIAWFVVIGFLIFIAFSLKISEVFSRGALLTFTLGGLTALLAVRAAWSGYLVTALRHGHFSQRKVILIKEEKSPADQSLIDDLSKHGLSISQTYSLTSADFGQESLQQLVASTTESARSSDIEDIVIAFDWSRLPAAREIINALQSLPLQVRLVVDPTAADLINQPRQRFGATLAIQVRQPPLTWTDRIVKRSFDFLFASVGLIALCPLFVLVAILIKLDSSGPVLFRQTRCGYNTRRFEIYKFRSMNVLENADVVTQARRFDNRVTRVGRFLRSTSIDELPQLWNVLRGEMSIIGPRPHAVAHDTEYHKLIGNYAFRRHVKPGLTGWAQVSGCRGETATVESMAERVSYDLWYIDNWSIWLDAKIVLKTCWMLVVARNAY